MCLSLLKTDFLSVINAVIDEKLSDIEVENSDGSAVVVMVCSGGYPEKYEKGKEISGLDTIGQNKDFDYIFHSSTVKKGDKYYSNGGRVLGVVALGKTVKEAQDKVYSKIDEVSFENSFYRKDIGGKR